MKAMSFPTIGVAVVAMLGGFQVQPLSAAEPVCGTQAACDTYAQGYAAGFCAAKGHEGYQSVTYTCNADGTATIISVSCIEIDRRPHPTA